jgi:hypothetical protein
MLVAAQWLLILLVVLGVFLLSRRPEVSPVESASGSPGAGRDAEPQNIGRVLRWRCEDCKRAWFSGENQRSDSTPVLLVKRLARRRARTQKKIEPAWARATGSDRCPTCFSANVRPSSRQ